MKSKLIVLLAGLGIGYWLGYARFSPKPIQETNAPEIRQADGSLVLERNKDVKPPKSPLNPFIGSEWIRHSEVTIRPTQVPQIGSNAEIDPIKVCFDLLRLQDKTYRVIVKAEGGEVLGGVDIPIETKVYPDPPKWAAGGILLNDGYGLFIQRNVGAFLIGLDVTKTHDKALKRDNLGYSFRAGIRF